MREHVQNTAPNPGLMKKVTVRGYTTRSDHGNEIREPMDPINDYATMRSLSGRELQAEKMIVSDVRFLFEFRYRPNYKSNMTISKDGRVFEIVEILHDETYHRRSDVYAKEINPA